MSGIVTDNLTATNINVSTINNLSYPQGKTHTAKYYQNAPVIDMNSAPFVLLFDAALPDIIPGTTPIVSYTSGPAGGFTLLVTGVYNITVSLRPSTAEFRSLVNLLINGIDYKGSYLTPYDNTSTNTAPQSINFSVTIFANAGDLLTVNSEPVVAGTINVNGNDIHGQATSTITITYLNDGQ